MIIDAGLTAIGLFIALMDRDKVSRWLGWFMAVMGLLFLLVDGYGHFFVKGF